MAERKNTITRVAEGIVAGDILPGLDMIKALKERQMKIAIGSSSKNARDLAAVGLEDEFDSSSTATSLPVETDPECHNRGDAARHLPEECLWSKMRSRCRGGWPPV